jgi:ppGpp synthetase/RelA/SpoT-type nucleotidyltranferase
MDNVAPRYSRTQVNRAGDILIDRSASDEQQEWAREVLSNWRSCHAYPINTFQATLRSKLKRIAPTAFVAQRLKRSPSIVAKLERFAGMKLARMQDIGGLRAVVGSLDEVRALESDYRTPNHSFKHELVTTKDYIQHPKDTGYRSLHLVYKYANDKVPEYNGLLLELQIRTRLQHAWATAVETMGTFLRYALKSSEGPGTWLEFFAAAGSAFATLEGCAPVPGYGNQSRAEIFESVTREARRLDVYSRLAAFSVALNAIDEKKDVGSFYHLITLNPAEKTVYIQSYGRRRLEQASRDYAAQEKRIADGEDLQVVLVSAGPIEALKRAYPNYFLDTREFVQTLTRIQHELTAMSEPERQQTPPPCGSPAAGSPSGEALGQGDG